MTRVRGPRRVFTSCYPRHIFQAATSTGVILSRPLFASGAQSGILQAIASSLQEQQS